MTGKPPPTSSVSNAASPPRSRPTTARPRRTASRHASTARSCEPTWRWIPRGRSAPSPWLPSHSTSAVASVSVNPNFDAPSPTASSAMVSGTTSGLSRTRTSSGGRAPTPSPARRAMRVRTSASSADSSATHMSGVAAGRGADRLAQVGVGLADTLERDPLRSGRRRAERSPTRPATRRWPRNRARSTSATISGTSLALTEYWRIHGSGKAVAHRRRGPVQRAEVGDVGRRAMACGRRAERVRDGRWRRARRPRAGACQSGMTSRTTVLTALRITAPTMAATRVSAVSRSGGKSPTFRSNLAA